MTHPPFPSAGPRKPIPIRRSRAEAQRRREISCSSILCASASRRGFIPRVDGRHEAGREHEAGFRLGGAAVHASGTLPGCGLDGTRSVGGRPREGRRPSHGRPPTAMICHPVGMGRWCSFVPAALTGCRLPVTLRADRLDFRFPPQRVRHRGRLGVLCADARLDPAACRETPAPLP
jgi:hypothetical protein